MLEKLLENWLDKASERSYQAVFVQMLAAEGYTVLHSTRHCLLEFGKDILAVASDGVGCAFQLKGDPRGRMKVGEFRRDIQPQLVQLMAQSPSYPGFPPGPHRSYLVSNGQFDEEVQAAVREMNNGPYPSKTTLWSRGKLLEMCKTHASALWPSELEDNRALLEIYMADPREPLAVATLATMLESILGFRDENRDMSQTEYQRAASSAAWVTGIAIATYAEEENYQAIISAWTLCCVSIIGASEKHDLQIADSVGSTLVLAYSALVDALAELWGEVTSREKLIEGETFTDSDIYNWRIGVLYGLLTCLAVADEEMSILTGPSRNALHEWLTSSVHKLDLWGEASVATIVPWLVWLRKNDPTSRPDNEIDALATMIIESNQPKSIFALANPYYDYEAVFRHNHGMKSFAKARSLDGQAIAGNAYTAELALHLLVRTNLKSRCKLLWPQFTKISHHSLDIESAWNYCLYETPTGTNVTKIYPSTYQWSKLKDEATVAAVDEKIPAALHRHPWLLALWWHVAPHRINTGSVRVFVEALLPGWGR